MSSVDNWVHTYTEKPHDLERVAADDDVNQNETTNSTTNSTSYNET